MTDNQKKEIEAYSGKVVVETMKAFGIALQQNTDACSHMSDCVDQLRGAVDNVPNTIDTALQKHVMQCPFRDARAEQKAKQKAKDYAVKNVLSKRDRRDSDPAKTAMSALGKVKLGKVPIKVWLLLLGIAASALGFSSWEDIAEILR